MDETLISAKEMNLLEIKQFCRLCFSSIDEETLLFCSASVVALYDRIHRCTGVKLQDFPDVCPTACDGCISQLVICEKFVQQCREVDQKLQQLLQLRNETRVAATGQNEMLIPAKQHNPAADEDVPKSQVQHLHSQFDETTGTGKSTGDEFLLIEIVDEYEVDNSSENVPIKSDINTADVPVDKVHCGKGRKTIRKSQCSLCGTMQQNLKQHMLVHTGEKKHACPLCQKVFAQKGNLTYHMHQHSGHCPYRCDRCEKAFKDPTSLRSHKLTHTDERKHQCDVCNEKFKHKRSLVVHMMTHTQDKRYTCTECKRSFITSWTLKKHMRTHTGERPYKCTDCSKCFKASHNLTLHKLSHTKERRFQCDICASWFSYKHVLKTHMNVHLKAEKMRRKQDIKQEREKSNGRIIKS